jgi:hypothetical protein
VGRARRVPVRDAEDERRLLIRAHVEFVGAGTDPHRKIGVIIRKGSRPIRPTSTPCGTATGLTSLQHRMSRRRDRDDQGGHHHADVLELKREGRRYIMGVAKFGEPMVTPSSTAPTSAPTSTSACSPARTIRKVKETRRSPTSASSVPPKTGWVPYRDYIGSNLEVMDVGHRAPPVMPHVADLDPGARTGRPTARR